METSEITEARVKRCIEVLESVTALTSPGWSVTMAGKFDGLTSQPNKLTIRRHRAGVEAVHNRPVK